MRQNLDPQIRELLDISRVQWATRAVAPEWSNWLARSCKAAFREFAPLFPTLRIHSLPGTLWEVLRDSKGQPNLIADDELVASLAELRNLSFPDATIESGYDRMILLLADGFRTRGDLRRFASCLGWAVPRAEQIAASRIAAINSAAYSAESLVILFHEMAHHVLNVVPADLATTWRAMSAAALEKIVAALEHSELREQAMQDMLRSGLSSEHAENQINTYLTAIQSSPKLTEELTCDLLAAIGFLNLKTPTNLLTQFESGPTETTTKEVGDAFFVAHGAIQNMQLLVAAEEIAATARDPLRLRGFPHQEILELTARSSALVHLLANFLRAWCTQRTLQDSWSARIANGEPAFERAIEKRNAIRTRTLLDPLETLDGCLIDEDRFVEFNRQGTEHLRLAHINASSFSELDAARWRLTMVSPADQ